MAIVLNGDTGISSIGTLTGVTSISSASANTPVIMQDSGSNSNTCRAWVNFNGTGTVAILASFNVSSITDNGTGDYTVNFTNAMPDINYSVAGIGGPNSSAGTPIQIMENNLSARTTSSIRIWNLRSAGGGALDVATISVQIFR